MQLRNFTIAFYCMVLALFASASVYAQSFNVAVTNASVDCSGTPQLTFTLTATSNADYLVDNWNIWLNFNPAAINNPQITFAPGFTGNYGTGIELQSNYTQFNSFWNGAANAQTQTFSSSPTTLCTITFNIVNSALPSGLTFEAAQTFGSDNNFNEYQVVNANIFGGVSLACPAGPCAISGITAGAQTACVPATNTYTQAVTVTYANPPAGGQLSVNGQNFAITSSPQTVILSGLTANGAGVNVTASFTAEPACTFTANNLFTAPASCAPVCNISGITAGAQTACVPATNTYTQQVTVTYSNAPASGQLNVNGQNFAITGSPQTVTLTNLPSDGSAVSVTASFTASPACTFTANNLFTAPASCAPVCAISDITAGTPSACNPATNTYSVSVTITFSNPPAVGNLLVNAGSGNQTFTGIGTSPRTVTLTNLPATGNPVNVTASFSTNPGCLLTVNNLFTAPANCTPVCTISSLTAGTQTACNPATNTYTQQVIVTYSTPPASGQLTVNGQNFAITGSPQTVTLTGLNANGNSVNVSASFTANPGCSLTQSALFTAPESCAVVDPCAGVTVSGSASYDCANGLSLSASGGSGNYTFTANGNAVTNGALLANGTYSIVAADDNGCADATPFSLTVNSLTSIAVSYDCVTGLAVTSATGVGPFTYTANGAPVALGDLLPDGSNTIEATDANGCSASDSFDNTCNICVGVDVIVTASYDCEGGNLTVTADGGTGPYTFLANGIGVSTGSALPNGTYTIIATDANGCTGTLSDFAVACGGACAGVTIDVTATYNCATGLLVSATGGAGDYTFNLGDGAILTNGTYTIVATDENNCTGSVDITVDCISCAGVVIDVVASYDCNSGLSVSASGGTGSYTITANGAVVTNGSFLFSGFYNINVFDSNGCSGSTTLTVSNIQFSASYSCATGLSLIATGGSGSYTFSTTQGSISNGATLANGTYQIIATDSNGCLSNFVNVTVNCGGTGDPCDGVTINASASYSCASGLSVSASGGTGPYTFSTSNGATLANGTYTITATDANGCTGTTSVIVNCGGGDPCDGVTINVTATYSCATGLSVSATGGTAPYGFGPLAGTFLPEGVYIVSATDANGCSGTTVLTVGDCNNPPITNPDAATVIQGTGSVTVDVTANDTDPDGDAIVLVSAGPASAGGTVTSFNPDGTVTVAIDPGFSGTITIPYTIQDANGASASGIFTVTVFACAANAGSVASGLTIVCADALAVQVSGTGFNNTPGYSQTYLLVDGSGTIIAVSASGNLSNPGSGTYTVYALNYANASTPSFGVGTSLAALNAQAGDACFALSASAQAVVLTPVTLAVETFCDPTVDGGFFVRFTANGGFPAYSGLGGYTTNLPVGFGNYIPWNPSIGAGDFVFGPLPNGLPCFFVDIVSDGILCTVKNIEVCAPEPCIIECTPEAGDVSPDLQAVCDGGSASVISSGIEVDLTAGEVAFYVVHTSPNLADGGVVGVFPVPFDVTTPATFSLSDLTGGTTNTVYYVSAIVGRNDNDGDGLPDLGDICTDVAGSTPVVFLTPLQASVEPICNDDTQEYTLVVAVTGSYPDFDPTATYTVFGDFNGDIDGSILIPGYASGSAYFIGITDAAGCSFTDANLVTCKPTPITLLRFDGKVMTEGNLLNWTTATETDNDFFTLMRSTDGINFTAVGTVDGAGNSIIARNYEFMDKNAPNGLSYYRLDQTDFDGTNTIASEVITLRREAVKFSIVEVVPVPTSGILHVNFATGIAGEVEYTIYDVAGRKINTQKTTAQNGLNTLTLDVTSYAAGVYFITLNNGSDIQTTRFVKE